jgi:hypothetical protein
MAHSSGKLVRNLTLDENYVFWKKRNCHIIAAFKTERIWCQINLTGILITTTTRIIN